MVCLSELFLRSATHLVFRPRTKLAATWRVGLERLSFAGCLRLKEYGLQRLSFRLPVHLSFSVLGGTPRYPIKAGVENKSKNVITNNDFMVITNMLSPDDSRPSSSQDS